MKNIKLHAIILALIIVSELIGTHTLKFGIGRIVLLPMLYALLLGILTTPKFLNLSGKKEMLDASSLVGVTLMLLMARYGTLVGPTLPKILAASPALILQEFGNLGTVLLGVPVAVYLGLKRETIGAAHSIAREPNVALIGEKFGLDSSEGRGVMGVYIAGTVFGTIFFGLMASVAASVLPIHPYALAMASGVGSASMMTAAVGSLVAMYPDMADQLAGGFKAQLEGIEIYRGQARRGQPRKQRIIKGNDRQIARNGDAPECAEPLQRHREDVVADDDSGRAILPLDERVQRGVLHIQRLHLDAVLRVKRKPRRRHGSLIAALAVCRKHIGVVAAQIGDAAMSQLNQMLRCFLSGEKIVVVDIDRLIGIRIGFADQHINLLCVV